MSREYVDKTYVLKNQNNQEEFNRLYYRYQSDYAFFHTRLLALQTVLANAQEDGRASAHEDFQATQKILSTFQAYLEKQKASIKLGFITTNKIDDTDFAIFKVQAKNLHALRSMLEVPQPNNLQSAASANPRSDQADDAQSTTSSTDSNEASPPAANAPSSQPAQSSSDLLSKLIDDAKNMAYDVSYTEVWWRRVKSVLTGLVAFAAATALILLFMTPGVNVIAALTAVPTALLAMFAYWFLRKPETLTIHTHVQAAGANVSANFTMPDMSTAGMIFSGFMGVSAVRKLHIMNPPREVAARDSQTATINQLTDLLKKRIAVLQNDEVKIFLGSVVDKADRMYNEGASAWFYETRTAKTKKAHLILRETAKIMERDDFSTLTVESILQKKINQTDYAFADLLNAQRNGSTFCGFRIFMKKSSATIDALKQTVEKQADHIDEIALAIGG